MIRTWSEVGIELLGGATGEVRATCPQCSASRRKASERCLAVNTDKGVWKCWHCGWSGSLKSGTQVGVYTPIAPLPQRPSPYDKREALRRVWRASRPVSGGDPVYRYLHGRGITLPLSDMSRCIRFHPALPYRHEGESTTRHPAMITSVQDKAGLAVTIHRVYLSPDGRKADVPNPKRLMPCPSGATNGGAARLYAAGEMLCVTEGIETALAVRLQTGLPVWSAISAGGMEQLVVPPEVRLIVICGDHDKTGINAMHALAARLTREGRSVKLMAPTTPGHDWADEVAVRHD